MFAALIASLVAVPLLAAQQATPAQTFPRNVTITVTDESGQPVSGALVELWDDATQAGVPTTLEDSRFVWWESSQSGGSRTAPAITLPAATQRTDAAGHLTLQLRTPDTAFVVSAPEAGGSGVWVASGIEGESLSLGLRKGTTLAGLVERADGTPAVGATVVFGKAPITLPNHGVARVPDVVTSGADGRFEVSVGWGFEGHAWAQVGDARTEQVIVSAMSSDPIVMRVPGAFHIRGLCLGPEAEPLAGLTIYATRRASSLRKAKSGPDGAFDIELAQPGKYELEAHGDIALTGLHLGCPVLVEVSAAAPTADVQLAFTVPLNILGMVTGDAKGAVTVAARIPEDPFRHGMPSAGPLTIPATFRLSGFMEGERCDIVATLEDYGAPPGWLERPTVRVRNVPAGAVGVGLVFGEAALRGGVATVRCVDAETDVALVGAKVQEAWLSNLGGRPQALSRKEAAPEVADALGTVQLGRLAFGEDHVYVVTADDHAPLALGPFVAGPEPLELRAALVPIVSCNVRVLGADGRPAADASLVVHVPPGDPAQVRYPFSMPKTDSEGQAEVSAGLGQSRWLQAAAGVTTSLPVLVVLGRDMPPQELTLLDPSTAPRGALDVLVQDSRGRPMPDMPVKLKAAWIRLEPSVPTSVDCTTDESGRAHAEDLWPAIWTSVCKDEDRGGGFASAVVLPGKPASVVITVD